MNVRALRGVCIGPDRHLAPGQVAELDPATGRYLVNIGAVEAYSQPPAPAPAATPPQLDLDPQPDKPARKAPASKE